MAVALRDVKDVLDDMGFSGVEATCIHEAVCDALYEAPITSEYLMTLTTGYVLLGYNRNIREARTVANGLVAAGTDYFPGFFDDIMSCVIATTPLAAVLGKSVGTVLEGFVGMTVEGITPALAVEWISDRLRVEYLASINAGDGQA